MKKKIVSVLLAVTMLSSVMLSACGDEKAGDVAGTDTAVTESEDAEGTVDITGTTDPYQDLATDKLDRSDEGYVLVWNDEFDGDSLDLSKWSYQYGTGMEYGLSQWGNSEQQYYTKREENVKVEDGYLHLIAIKEEPNYEGSQFTSGRIRTITDDNEPLLGITYGRVEAKMRLTGGPGIWPAFWMLPCDPSIYGTWAASGELDIMEARCRIPDRIGGTAHFGRVWPENTYISKDFVFDDGSSIRDFHTYAMEWDPETIKWYVDDVCYQTLNGYNSHGAGNAADYTSPAPFDVPFYIILNVAVGGGFDKEAIVKKECFPAEMTVDFVRVFQKEQGYEEAIKASIAADDGLDYDCVKTPMSGKYLIYNGTFDLGTNRLGYWHVENMDAQVPSFVLDKEGKEDYSRAAILTATGADARIYQTGMPLDDASKYGVAFDISSEAGADITIRVTGDDGTVLLEQSVSVPENVYKVPLQTMFETDKAYENSTFSFYVGEGGTVSIDNVVFMNVK